MTEPAPERMSLAAFLEWDDGTDTRYELVDGRVVAMAPTLEAHGTIVGNLFAEFRNRLKPPCRAVVGAGISPPNRADSFYVADVAVTCTPPDPGTRIMAEPTLIVEVLSPSSVRTIAGSSCSTTAAFEQCARSCWCPRATATSSTGIAEATAGRSRI